MTWKRQRTVTVSTSGAKDAACTRSLCSIRSGSTNCINFPCPLEYLFSIGDPQHPSPLCPLCLMHDHTSSHLFECKSLPTSLSSLDESRQSGAFPCHLGGETVGCHMIRVLDSAGSTLVEWGRQQQQLSQSVDTPTSDRLVLQATVMHRDIFHDASEISLINHRLQSD